MAGVWSWFGLDQWQINTVHCDPADGDDDDIDDPGSINWIRIKLFYMINEENVDWDDMNGIVWEFIGILRDHIWSLLSIFNYLIY